MEFLKISLIILVAVIMANCIPVANKNIWFITVLSSSVVVLLYIIRTVTPVMETIKNISDSADMGDLSIIYKSMGISLITQFVADTSADSGNKALANQMIFAGKIAIIILALPIYMQVLEMIGGLLL